MASLQENIPDWVDVSLFSNKDKSKDIEAIHQVIYTILGCKKGEWLFDPTFGNSVENLLFDPIDSITSNRILYEFSDMIEKEDPRLSVDLSLSKVEPLPDENRYNVRLVLRALYNAEDRVELKLSLFGLD